jgi:YbgC/YbaW family acyl-CoA thioester hydrolase
MNKPQYRVKILESHLDTLGHVNNAQYLRLFEEARWEVFTRNGLGVHDIRQLGIGPVVLELNARFMKELKLREEILILTQLESTQGKISLIKQQMIKDDGTVACEATFKFALFDTIARKLMDGSHPVWQSVLHDWSGLSPL